MIPHKLDILLISETHLTASISDSTVHLPGYTLLRNDSGRSHTHGVCAYISTNIRYDSVNIAHPNVISFRLTSCNVFIYVVYRPPSNSSEMNSALIEFLMSNCSNQEVVLLGDFNLPSLNWARDDFVAACASTTDSAFLGMFDTLGLAQWVWEPTFPRSGNTLDLILTTEQDRVGNVMVLPPPPGCDHCSTLCEYVFDMDIQGQSHKVLHYVWHRGRYDIICAELRNVDWDFEFQYLNAEQSLDKLLEILHPFIQQCVPIADASRDQTRVPWKTNVPNSLRRKRHMAWDKYKHDRDTHGRRSLSSRTSLTKFLEINKEYRTFALRSQVAYERSLLTRMKENPKLFHSYIRHKKQFRSSVGPLRLPSGNLSDDPVEMAECFSSSFASVYNKAVLTNPAKHQTFQTDIDQMHVSISDVEQVLSNLDVNSAMGPDRLHPMLLRSCAAYLAYPFYVIFCRSLAEGVLPAHWKRSLVIPIFKKGLRYDALNYRPISLTSVPCKCLEKLICHGLYSFLTHNDLLTNDQFGFRPGRSTEDQLLLTYNDVSTWLDEGSLVDLVLFDFSKAFDVVSHAILINKLMCIGVRGQVLSWIHHFLVGRSMSVMIKDAISQPREVLSGVPQGSVLGPILFLVYINHIVANLSCKCKIFADDLKIYMQVGDGQSYQADQMVLQRDIETLHETAKSWGLYMNLKKCSILRFQRRFHDVPLPTYVLGGEAIVIAHSQTDLGITVDDCLKFHEHACNVTRKAGALAQNLLKSTVCRSSDFMVEIFKSHIRPLLEYASPVWNTGYHQDLRRLESVQRLWTRHVLGLDKADYGTRLRALNLYSVQGRLLRADLIKCWKIFHGKSTICPSDLWTLDPASRTRGHMFKIQCKRYQVDARARFFTARVTRDWNSLPASAVSSGTIKQFKVALAAALGDRLYEFIP